MSIRNSETKKWNSGVIWANPTTVTYYQQIDAMPLGLEPAYVSTNFHPDGRYGIPLRVVKLFYTNHGVPITEDKTWDYSKRFDLETVPKEDRFNLIQGYTTAYMNINREPRFYADLGFDGSIWYGQGHYDDHKQLLNIKAKSGQPCQIINAGYSVSGYWPKKLANYKTIIARSNFETHDYSWPIMRLDGLYLLYAEAKNEADGPGPQVYKYLNLVRKRAGLPTVQYSWTHYSTNPNQYKTKNGLRKIIHRERRIELAFEGKNYWAIRRWKKAIKVFNGPIAGWSIRKSTAKGYYRKHIVFQQKFTTRDYLWPIGEHALLNNPKLTQNPGWGR